MTYQRQSIAILQRDGVEAAAIFHRLQQRYGLRDYDLAMNRAIRGVCIHRKAFAGLCPGALNAQAVPQFIRLIGIDLWASCRGRLQLDHIRGEIVDWPLPDAIRLHSSEDDPRRLAGIARLSVYWLDAVNEIQGVNQWGFTTDIKGDVEFIAERLRGVRR